MTKNFFNINKKAKHTKKVKNMNNQKFNQELFTFIETATCSFTR